jgi:hypothetical protein
MEAPLTYSAAQLNSIADQRRYRPLHDQQFHGPIPGSNLGPNSGPILGL